MVEITWDDLLTWHTRPSFTPEAPKAKSDVPPRSVLAEIAQDISAATAALSRADAALVQAGALPPELRASTPADPKYGHLVERSDWFIEPLLTIGEVASVLRMSTRAVRRLPIASLIIGGEARYRQSAIRSYLQKQETKGKAW
jgi:hypothetical protein